MIHFTPIEELFPRWMMARPLVTSLLPARLAFVPDEFDRSSVSLDYAWSAALQRLVPPEDRAALHDRLQLAAEHVAAAIPQGRLEKYLREPVTRLTLMRMDDELYRVDREREVQHHPPLAQIIRHVMGIEPAIGALRYQPTAPAGR